MVGVAKDLEGLVVEPEAAGAVPRCSTDTEGFRDGVDNVAAWKDACGGGPRLEK